MKKTLLAVALAACATSAFAEPTAVLKVTGILTNSSCSPSFAGGDTIDYGYIHLADLSPTAVNQIGKKGGADLTISCSSPTKVAWTIRDDRTDSTAVIAVDNGTFTDQRVTDKSQLYGVGKTAGGVKIGNYSLYVDISKMAVSVDGVSASASDLIYHQGNAGDASSWTWSTSTNGSTQGGDGAADFRWMTVAETGTKIPYAFTSATFPLVATLAIQPTNTLAITDDTTMDGQMTVTMYYL
ncbi:DUF1120 domain-containing protein [Escherichia coli]|uniref:DUF1120 domain-containing protein n=1 Tax=Escherichia coli TaxID=562 RepID=UPI000BB84C3F|nr:DUF1120 domain-containing protein [Escherichia coli]EFB5449818.1 DUF1120 domain-containing protein [Escherichia coli O157]EEX1158710.1 DUF1120 domain-containing protein [Escherichia coli]EFJ6802291.1 DUF1120 domain-containing protein [Escherichia coli]EFO0907501.1 DUF1120 domain-containing protein [Escherichia coli O157]EFO1903357.1 DUF1120 domain-containing protein [Escherichia coli]